MSGIGNRPRPFRELGFTFAMRSAEHGFTLIEALVVVAVSALVAGIGFPRIEQSLSAWRMQSSAVAVQAALEDARAQALRTGAPARFAVMRDTGDYARPGAPAGRLHPSVRFGEGSDLILFFGDGSSSGGRILIEAGSGRRATISVSTDTGLIGLIR